MVCLLICILKFIARKLLDTLETGIEVKSNFDHLLCDRHLNGPGVFKRGENGVFSQMRPFSKQSSSGVRGLLHCKV